MNLAQLYGSLRQTTPDQFVQHSRKKQPDVKTAESIFGTPHDRTPNGNPQKRHAFPHLLKYETLSPYVFRQDPQPSKKINPHPPSNLQQGFAPTPTREFRGRKKEESQYQSVSPIGSNMVPSAAPQRRNGKKQVSTIDESCSFTKVFQLDCSVRCQERTPTLRQRSISKYANPDRMWELLTFNVNPQRRSPMRFHTNVEIRNKTPQKGTRQQPANYRKQFQTEF